MSLRAFAKMRNNPNLEFVNFLNNNVAVAHCVLTFELLTQGAEATLLSV